ncbi:MAG: hypothetical protein EBT55_05090, partial [Proteobacteria bacterium]|nr:hypothetical protein [Pseudomonadota bacterium]
CEINNCSVLNANTNSNQNSANSLTHNDNAYCTNGYSYKQSSSTISGPFIANCPSHNDAGSLIYNNKTATCTINSCFANLTHGTKILIQTGNSKLTVFNNLSCNRGYNKPTAPSDETLLCLDHLATNKTIANCQAKTCTVSMLNATNNIVINTENNIATSQFTCNTGYQNPAFSAINFPNCNTNPTSDKPCYNSIANYYLMNCPADNTTFVIGSCSPKTCTISGAVNNAGGSTVVHGTQIYCGSGYQPQYNAGSTSLVANCNVNPGSITGGSCVANSNCNISSGIGYVGIANASGSGIISCIAGYSGSASYICNADGNAVINNTCSPTFCSATIANGTLQQPFAIKTGDAISGSCNAGYQNLTWEICNASSSTSCIENQSNYTTLKCLGSEHVVGSCSPKICSVKIANGTGIINNTTSGSLCSTLINNASLVCNAGYTKTANCTNDKVVCSASSVDIGSCVANNCTVGLRNGNNTTSSTGNACSTIFANLSCNSGYHKPASNNCTNDLLICNDNNIIGDCQINICQVSNNSAYSNLPSIVNNGSGNFSAPTTCATGYSGTPAYNCNNPNNANISATLSGCNPNSCSAVLKNSDNTSNIRSTNINTGTIDFNTIFDGLTCLANQTKIKVANYPASNFVCDPAGSEHKLGNCYNNCLVPSGIIASQTAYQNNSASQLSLAHDSTSHANIVCSSNYNGTANYTCQNGTLVLSGCNPNICNASLYNATGDAIAIANVTAGANSIVSQQIITNNTADQLLSAYNSLNCGSGYIKSSATYTAPTLPNLWQCASPNATYKFATCQPKICTVLNVSNIENSSVGTNLTHKTQVYCINGYSPVYISGSSNLIADCSDVVGKIIGGSCVLNQCKVSITSGTNTVTSTKLYNHNTLINDILADTATGSVSCSPGYSKPSIAGNLNCNINNATIQLSANCIANDCTYSGYGYVNLSITASGSLSCTTDSNSDFNSGNFNYVCNPNNQVAITNPCNCKINSASNGGSIIGYGAYKFSSSIATSTLTNNSIATTTTTLACSTGYNTDTIKYLCNANGLKLFGCTPPLPSTGINSLTMWLEAKDNLTSSFGVKLINDNSNISKWQDLNQRGENQFV